MHAMPLQLRWASNLQSQAELEEQAAYLDSQLPGGAGAACCLLSFSQLPEQLLLGAGHSLSNLCRSVCCRGSRMHCLAAGARSCCTWLCQDTAITSRADRMTHLYNSSYLWRSAHVGSWASNKWGLSSEYYPQAARAACVLMPESSCLTVHGWVHQQLVAGEELCVA